MCGEVVCHVHQAHALFLLQLAMFLYFVDIMIASRANFESYATSFSFWFTLVGSFIVQKSQIAYLLVIPFHFGFFHFLYKPSYAIYMLAVWDALITN